VSVADHRSIQDHASIHVHHNILHSVVTLTLISLLVGSCIALDASRRSSSARSGAVDRGSTLNPIIPNLRLFPLDLTSTTNVRRAVSAALDLAGETRTRADEARKTYLARALGVMVAGVLLNEEIPSWSDGVIAALIYAGK
jgi:hypothetical protein